MNDNFYNLQSSNTPNTFSHSNLSTSGKNSPITFPVFSHDISRANTAIDPSSSLHLSNNKSKLGSHGELSKQTSSSDQISFNTQSIPPINQSFSHMDYYTHKLNNHAILNGNTGNILEPYFKQFENHNNGFDEPLGNFGNEKQFMGFPLDYIKDTIPSDMNNVLSSNFDYIPNPNARNENTINNPSQEVNTTNHDIPHIKSSNELYNQPFLSPPHPTSAHFGLNNLSLPSASYSSQNPDSHLELDHRSSSKTGYGLHSNSQSNPSNPIIHSISSKVSLGNDLSNNDIPPVSDPSDPTATPRPQNPRFKGDMYSPKWVRYNGQKKEGYCDLCEPGKWLQLKNSAFWYHKQFYHGICSTSGKFFCAPIRTRTKDNQMVEGLCHQCNRWVPVSSTKRRNSVLWFRHAQKCHVYHKPKPLNAKKLEFS